MASLYYYYSSMNAGKSSHLLQANHNYRERGMNTMLFNAEINDRDGVNKVSSRIGISAPATTFKAKTDMYKVVSEAHQRYQINCVLIDEAQFLTEQQVNALGAIVDELNIPVLAYGLRTDYLGQLFEGSKSLLAIADHLEEIKGVCYCGRKATMVARIDECGSAVTSGSQIVIGGNDLYVSLCRKHHSMALRGEINLR
ncbi:thymidine kinase [Vibrio coralliirubri]|uniref:thymidine kinase n=1 Tax=Vibrio coralliirubri TaxID=1516159 RepID=UPI0022841C14|nr:thymidine kinase [Vibrio coralliirubri]MCY9861053.1 thymidine kinase [Vibrio coralliirubri]